MGTFRLSSVEENCLKIMSPKIMNFSITVVALIAVFLLSHQAKAAALNAQSEDDASLILAEARRGVINADLYFKITGCLAKAIGNPLTGFLQFLEMAWNSATTGGGLQKTANFFDELRKDLTIRYDYLGGLERFCDENVPKPYQFMQACKAKCVLDILG